MNIEELFKSSLENSEIPFDPKAWESMSSRLDQAFPVSNAPKPSYKWAWISGAAVVAGISAFLLFGNDTNTTTGTSQPAQTASIKVKEEAAGSADKAESNKAENVQPTAARDQKNELEKPKKANSNKGYGQALCSGYPGPGHAEGFGLPVSAMTGKIVPEIINPFAFVLPLVNEKYCEGEKLSFRNTNDYSISLISNNGTSYTVDGGKILTVDLAEGTYSFVYTKHGKPVTESAFKVLPAPKADFSIDAEMLYDHGLPVNELKAVHVQGNDYTWTNAKGEVLSRDKKFDVHLFTKGDHEITLKVGNANGCSGEVTKTVRCESNYNLLAVTGFNPESSYEENRTFIPYALSESGRNIPFEMEIIDFKTGQVVYKTKNANEPWDGVSKITNQMVPSGSTFIWRVTIYKKEIGEPKNVYQGTITRI